jgi:Protein of unknown function (DUF2490)
VSWGGDRRFLFPVAVLCCCVLTVSARAQQQQPQEDPEDEKRIGLWLDQPISVDLTASRSLEFEVHERFDEGASNLFEYFFQGGPAFRLRPWFMVLPIYRYQRFPGDSTTAYENRVQLNLTLSRPQGTWRPNLRTLIEGRFPDNRIASARLRFRPGVDYVLPVRVARRPAVVVTNEFFVVPGPNSFSAGGSFTQDRFQVGVRFPITDALSVRPYYMMQWVNQPEGWDGNSILGISVAIKARNKSTARTSRLGKK